MHKLITGLFTAVLLSACQEQPAPAPTKEAPQTASNNQALVAQYYKHFNAHNWEQMAAMYAESAEMKDPSLGPDMVRQSRAEIAQKYGELAQMFPDVRDSVVAVYPSGDKHIIVEFISMGTAPDQSTFRLPICTVFTIEDGLITQDFTYYDNFGE
jgi:ketosteroid isomerase-like protein